LKRSTPRRNPAKPCPCVVRDRHRHGGNWRRLGIRSPNTVLAWCRAGYIRGAERGGRTLIPLAEIERIRNGDSARAIKAADHLHDRAAPLGEDQPTSATEMELLHDARPGTLPWKHAHKAVG
jgi:hypothetical protein